MVNRSAWRVVLLFIVLFLAGSAAAWAYNEAPMLRELVQQGKLPPVEERLPENPVVVPVVEEIGQYGGTWNRAFLGAQ